MDFPINRLMSEKASEEWILQYFHPPGLQCPHCKAAWAEAREFRITYRSHLTVYRCQKCRGIYNLYSGTLFEARQLTASRIFVPQGGVPPTLRELRTEHFSENALETMRKALLKVKTA